MLDLSALLQAQSQTKTSAIPGFTNLHDMGHGAVGLDIKMSDMKPWVVTVEGVRDACMQGRIVDLASRDVPSDKRAESPMAVAIISEFARRAVTMGRMIDAGHIPNAVIRSESKRAGRLLAAGHIGMPFSEPWVLFHTWEDGPSAYLIDLGRADGHFVVCELLPLTLKGTARMLVMCDLCDFVPTVWDGEAGYSIEARPSSFRRLAAHEEGISEEVVSRAAGANCLDPVLAVLGMMATDGVVVETIAPSDKLNKARIKSGKEALPSRLRVNSAPYVTALLARGAKRPKGEPGGKHHASPVAHVRRGHVRHLASGAQTWVRDCLVAFNEGSIVARTHYTMEKRNGE